MAQRQTCLRSRRVITPQGVKPAAVVFQGDKILEVSDFNAVPRGAALEDVGDLVISPGLVDSHVHINEPGRTEWEGFESATKAAAAGGITTLVDMPLNSSPVTTTVDAFKKKLASAEGKLWVDCGFYAGLIPGNTDDLKPLIDAGVLGVKAFLVHSGIDEFPNATEEELCAGMPIIAKSGLPLLVHCELQSHSNNPIIPKSKSRNYADYISSRPRQWEHDAIDLMVRLCGEFSCRTHVVHLSSADAVPMLAKARKSGHPLTIETCPHYLVFSAEEIHDGDTRFKCAPPIRENENRMRLWEALRDKTIDFIVSDHSPSPPELKLLKEGDFQKAWGGIASLQFGLPAVWTEAKKLGFGVEDISRWMSGQPAKFLSLDDKKGSISPGHDADFVVWNPEESFTVEPSVTFHRHKVTPYEGKILFGVVEKTYLRGELAFEKGSIVGRQRGSVLYGKHKHKEYGIMTSDQGAAAFSGYIDLAAEHVGGKAMLASDEFFAAKENLLKPGRGVFLPDKFTDRGKWMDGWETRRKRTPGYDWCIIKLGLPGIIKGIDIDTNHFLGNNPSYASIEACSSPESSSGQKLASNNTKWTEILPKSPLKPGSQNLFLVSSTDRWTHIRFNIYPDGGVARLRIYGEVLPDWSKMKKNQVIDLAAVEHGGIVVAASDMFFGSKENLIMPGRAQNMGNGWETKRRRGPGYDWAIVRLGRPGQVKKVEVDTNHFKGNFPDTCSIDICDAAGKPLDALTWADFDWTEILAKTKLKAHSRHFFQNELKKSGLASHLRLNIYPDGGVSRLRIFGILA